MKKMIIFLVLAVMLVSPALSFAASPWTEGETYGDRVSGKLQFGLKNTLFGWLDLFFEPVRAASGCNDCENVWTGIVKGFTDAVINEVGGAVHLITFPLVVDLPLPENGVQFSSCCGDCPVR